MELKIDVMKARYLLIVLVSTFIVSCSSTKINATPEQLQALDELVASQSFIIESDWAIPQTSSSLIALQNSGLLAPGDNASRFSLIGNPNFLKLKGEVIDSELPYFGERQMVSNRNDAGGIKLENTIKNYKVEQNKDSSYTIKFDAKSENEGYKITIRLFPNLKSEMLVIGSKRFPIRYTGHVSSISE
jgi:hypothetical protein